MCTWYTLSKLSQVQVIDAMVKAIPLAIAWAMIFVNKIIEDI